MKSKKKWFPSPYTIVFSLTILAAILTHILPAGHYDYKVTGTDQIVKAVDVDKYKGEAKLVPIAGTYTHIQGNPQGIGDIFLAPIKGVTNAIDIIIFVLMIGTCITTIMKTGAIDAGIGRVIKRLKGRESVMIVILTIIFSAAGTIEGFQEESVAFYPVLIPILVKAGYDPILAIAVILGGAVMGIASSVINPFSTGIATKFAGLSIADGIVFRLIAYVLFVILMISFLLRYARKLKKDIKNSVAYESIAYFKSVDENVELLPEFTLRHKLILSVFGIGILIMIYGIIPFSQFGYPKLEWGWWFTEMSALFFAVTIIVGFISKFTEREFVNAFKDGLSEFIPVGFIIGLSRGIMIVLREGKMEDTVLNSFSQLLTGIPASAFLILAYFLFILLSFVITSTSAMATLTMPILAPLALMLHVPASLLISAYVAAQGTVFLINPADPILNAALLIGKAEYPQWIKFVFPIVISFMICFLILLTIGSNFIKI